MTLHLHVQLAPVVSNNNDQGYPAPLKGKNYSTWKAGCNPRQQNQAFWQLHTGAVWLSKIWIPHIKMLDQHGSGIPLFCSREWYTGAMEPWIPSSPRKRLGMNTGAAWLHGCFNTCKAVKYKDHQGPLSWDVLGCQSWYYNRHALQFLFLLRWSPVVGWSFHVVHFLLGSGIETRDKHGHYHMVSNYHQRYHLHHQQDAVFLVTALSHAM